MADCNCKRMAAMDDSSTATSMSKRRKIKPSSSSSSSHSAQSSLPFPPPSPKMLRLRPHARSHFPQLFTNSSDFSSIFSDDHSPPTSCCSSNELNDVAAVVSPLLDLQDAKSFETDVNKFSRETTPSSELCLVDSDEMDSPPPAVSLRRRPPVSKAPPSEEIEEFFAMAEKYEQKRFAEKYNYDIVKDVPLDGRYQWVRLKQP